MNAYAKRFPFIACGICTVLAMAVGNVQAQQVPLPQNAAEVTGPAPGPMTTLLPLVIDIDERPAPEAGNAAHHLHIRRMGWVICLSKRKVIQVPDFGDRFWTVRRRL